MMQSGDKKWWIGLVMMILALLGFIIGQATEKGRDEEKISTLELSQKVHDVRIEKVEDAYRLMQSDISAMKTDISWLRQHEEKKNVR